LSALFIFMLAGEMAFSNSCQFLEFWFQVVLASQRQWWRFSFVTQMQSLFFMKFIF